MDEPASQETWLSPEMDRILTTLSDHHRRMILMMLRRASVIHETDVMVRGSRDEESEHVEIQLRHTHLPKLVKAGYITWNEDTREISKGPNFEEIEPLLELMETHADELPPDWP